MSAIDIETKADKRENPVFVHNAAIVAGYSAACTLYAAIFLVALTTLGLVLIRQANMVNFNSLIANLEQRDRALEDLPRILDRVTEQRKLYPATLTAAADCNTFSGSVHTDDASGVSAPAVKDGSGSPPAPAADNCGMLTNTIKDHANALLLTEDHVRFKLANLDAWYSDYVAGITDKMPQIIPALRFIDSGSPWINAWARASYDLMEMFLLVSMGMLGGIIGVTRWLVKSTRRPTLPEYFYRPALGGIIALGAFVVFKAGQAIIGMPAQDGSSAVAASVFLLAALGLVSGLAADKALERIEKASGLFPAEATDGQTPRGVPQLKVVETAPTPGDSAAARPGRTPRPKAAGPTDEPPPENAAREHA